MPHYNHNRPWNNQEWVEYLHFGRIQCAELGFQEWFRHEIETRLKRLLNLGYENDSDKVKVAVVTLAFKNSDIIELLCQRGTAIINANWEEVEKIERKCIEVKNKHLDRLRDPCHIFITFQNEEGCERMK